MLGKTKMISHFDFTSFVFYWVSIKCLQCNALARSKSRILGPRLDFSLDSELYGLYPCGHAIPGTSMPFSRKGFSTQWDLVVEDSRTSRKALPDVESSRYAAQVQRVRKSWRNVSPSPPVLWVNFSQLFPKTGNGSRDRLQLRTQNRREQKSRTVGRHSCGQTQILADGSWLALVSLGNDHGKEQTNKKQCMVLKIQKTLQSQKKKQVISMSGHGGVNDEEDI